MAICKLNHAEIDSCSGLCTTFTTTECINWPRIITPELLLGFLGRPELFGRKQSLPWEGRDTKLCWAELAFCLSLWWVKIGDTKNKMVNSWKNNKSIFGPKRRYKFHPRSKFSPWLLTLWQQGHSQQNGWYLKMLPTGDCNGVREDGSGKDSYQLLEVDPFYGYWVLFTDLESMGKVHKRICLYQFQRC